MRWKTVGWVALSALLVVVWLVGLRLSGAVLLAWFGLRERVALSGDTYGQYWTARMLPDVAPYVWRIWLSGAAGFLPPLVAWGTALWLYVRWLAARRVAFPTRFATRSELRDAGMLDAHHGVAVGMRGGRALRWAGPGHLALCVPDEARAEAQLVSSLLDTPGSVVVLDCESRLWRATSGYRATLGTVRLIRPFASDGISTHWNPLGRLSPEADRRREELSAIASMLYDERSYGARPMREAKDAFTAFAGYVYDDAAARRALGGSESDASATFRMIHQVVSRARADGKSAIKKMLGKGFVAGDTRAGLDSLLRLPNRVLRERLASVEGPLPAFSTAFAGSVMSGPDTCAAIQHGAAVSIYLSVGDDLSPDQRRVAAILLWDLIRLGLGRRSGAAEFTCLINGIERVGLVENLSRVLHETAQDGPRFVLRTAQPARWREVYGSRAEVEAMSAMACRVVQAPSRRADENDFMDVLGFANEAGRQRPLHFDPSRATQLRRDLARLVPGQQIVVAESLAGPVICTTRSPLRDRHLAPRLLPPVTVDPLDPGDPCMPPRTLRAIGATAALALAATACSQDKPASSEQAVAAQAKKDGLTVDQERFLQEAVGKRDPNYKWEGYSEKLVPTKLGPNTFLFPMNLYEHQTGPDFQGSVGLTLRWPTLEAFPAGAVRDRAYAGAYLDEAISVRPRYVDKVPIEDVVRTSISPHPWNQPDDPIYHLSLRTKGGAVDGLVPYYIDMAKLKAYLSRRGAPVDDENLTGLGKDWFVSYSTGGKPVTFISCSPREIRGAKLVNERLEDAAAGIDRGTCNQEFVIEEFQIAVDVTYLRAYMKDWKRIETRIRSLFDQALQSAANGAGR